MESISFDNTKSKSPRWLENLQSIETQLLEFASVEELITIVLHGLRGSIACESISVTFFDQFYTKKWTGGFTAEDASKTRMVKEEIYTDSSPYMREGIALTVIDDLLAVEHPTPEQEGWNQKGIRAVLQVRLGLQTKLIGFIELGAKAPGFFTSEHQDFVRALSTQIRMAIRYFWMYMEVMEHGAELENKIFEVIRTEEERQKSEIFYQNIVEDQTELICRYDAAFNLTFVNRAYAAFYGNQPEAMIGTNILDRIPPEDREAAIRAIRTLDKTNPVSGSEHQTTMPDGTRRWHQWRDRALLDLDGNIIEYQGVGRDITAEKLLQQEHAEYTRQIEQMRQFLTATIDALPSSAVVLDPDGIIISANAAWKNYALLNNSAIPDYFVGASYLDVCDKAVGPMSQEAKEAGSGIRAVISGAQDHFYLEYSYSVQNVLFWFGMNVSPFDEPAPRRVVITHLDINERKAAELALRRANDTLEDRVTERTQELRRIKSRAEAILNNSSEAIVFVKPDLSIQQTNPIFNAMFACRADTYFGKSLLELVDGEMWSLVAELIQQGSILDRAPVAEVRARRSDGSIFDAELSVSIVSADYPQDQGLVCTMRDISERKRTEQALQAYAAELDDLYNNAPCGYHSLDSNGVFVRINNTELNWLGYSREEVIGKLRFADIITPESQQIFRESFPTFKKRGFIRDLNFDMKCRDGRIVPILLSAVAIYDERGEYQMSRSTFFDMTELKQSQDALRESEEKFRMFIEAAPIATVISNQDGDIVIVNRQSELLFGYGRDELLEQSIEILLPDHIREKHIHHRSAYLSDPHVRPMGTGMELFARHKTGKDFPVEVELSYVQTQTGVLIMAFVADITERKERERQLRYHASLQETVTDAVISTDMNFHIQSWNPAAERIYGWTAEEVRGKSSVEIFKTRFTSDETREKILNGFLKDGSWTSEVLQEHRDGHLINILGSIMLFKDDYGRPLGVVAVNHDISERKRAEAVLQEKAKEEHLFQSYLRELHELSIELTQTDDLDEFYRKAVEQGMKRLGFERLGLLLFDSREQVGIGTFGTDKDGNVVDERGLRFDPVRLTGILNRTLEHAERFSFEEHAELFVWQDGDTFKSIGTGWNAAAALWNGSENLGWLAADNAIRHNPPSKPQLDILALYALTIGTILGRKQIEVALRESEARLRSVMNSTSIGILLIDRDGVIRLGNQLGEEYCHWLFRQSLELGKTRIHDLSDAPALTKSIYEQVFAGEPMSHELSIEIDGRMVVLDIRYDPVTTSDGRTIAAAVSLINISQHKRAEEALRLAFRKERELGELKSRFVSMASHEFRTPLAAIYALSETLSAYRKKMTDDQIDIRLEHIRGQVNRLKEIVDDVLQLTKLQARRYEIKPTPLNLDALCREIIEEFAGRSDIKHQLHYAGQKNIPDLNLDQKLIRQLIGNLLTNAIKYSPEKSTVSVELNRTEDTVVLRVKDEGIGIPETDVNRLFTPFHRAANVGSISGTGLGLTIVKEAVDLHGGSIAVETQVDQGTTFIVTFPIQGINTYDNSPDH